MSITGSMFTATTALATFDESMAVVGHNIANLNTTGFKAARVEFADLLPTISAEMEIGHGVRLAEVNHLFRQGTVEPTSSVTDLAIGGNGMFVLADDLGGLFYSRAGQFHLDKTSNLVNPDGLFVQGESGNISLANTLSSPAQATTALDLIFNLDATSTTPATAFPASLDASPNAWLAASNFSAVATIYDNNGMDHDLTFLFRKNGPNAWDYRVVAPCSDLDALASGSSDLRQVSAGGTLIFDANGVLDTALTILTDIDGLSWVGAGSQTLAASNLDFSGATQYGQGNALFSLSQNGWPLGTLSGIAVDSQGVITGRYSNGNLQALNTLRLASFANIDGLDPVGDTLFQETPESGVAQFGQAGQGGLGSIMSGFLELSTVDLAQEFVAMIASQRAFQMNSKIITTADQMYAQAASLKE